MNNQGDWEGTFYSLFPDPSFAWELNSFSLHRLSFPWKQHILALNPVILDWFCLCLGFRAHLAKCFLWNTFLSLWVRATWISNQTDSRVWLARVCRINSVYQRSVLHMLTKFTTLQITKCTLGYSGEIKIKYWTLWLCCPPGLAWASRWHPFIYQDVTVGLMEPFIGD